MISFAQSKDLKNSTARRGLRETSFAAIQRGRTLWSIRQKQLWFMTYFLNLDQLITAYLTGI